jgi:methylmalonyl-CoA carboxyltransferase large subunit
MQDPHKETLALMEAMRAQIAALTQRVQALDAVREELNALQRQVKTLEHDAAQRIDKPLAPSEEDMVAISAAVAAFLGVRARIRQVRLVQSSAWAQVGRMGTHASHHTH